MSTDSAVTMVTGIQFCRNMSVMWKYMYGCLGHNHCSCDFLTGSECVPRAVCQSVMVVGLECIVHLSWRRCSVVVGVGFTIASDDQCVCRGEGERRGEL